MLVCVTRHPRLYGGLCLVKNRPLRSCLGDWYRKKAHVRESSGGVGSGSSSRPDVEFQASGPVPSLLRVLCESGTAEVDLTVTRGVGHPLLAEVFTTPLRIRPLRSLVILVPSSSSPSSNFTKKKKRKKNNLRPCKVQIFLCAAFCFALVWLKLPCTRCLEPTIRPVCGLFLSSVFRRTAADVKEDD